MKIIIKFLNAKDYGIPQNRERVFTISILKEFIEMKETEFGDMPLYKIQGFEFPQKQELKLKLKRYVRR